MTWSLLGCFGLGDKQPSLPLSTEVRVVLADAGIIFGEDSGMSGWRVSDKGPRRFAPEGAGSIVAADTTTSGVVAISAQTNGLNPQLWTNSGDGWTKGPALSHGPINQLLVAQDGGLWTEGDKGVYRSEDSGETWTRMEVPANLRLGAIKLGQSGGRIAFAGRSLVTTHDNGNTWQTLLADGSVQVTDGTWVAAATDKPSLRIGRISDQGVEWTDEVDGDWNAAAIQGHSEGVRIVGTQKLSTQVELLQGNQDGREFSSKRLRTRPEWVGLGNGVVWLDEKRQIHSLR